jgi:hypothetical protein
MVDIIGATLKSYTTYLQEREPSTTGVSMIAGLNGAGSAVEDVTDATFALVGLTIEPDPDAGARLHLVDATQTPDQYPGVVGSVGYGAIFIEDTRTGGYGSYGDILVSNVVSAATVAGEFDVGITSWMTHTNLTGGSVFGGWSGANTPAAETGAFSGGAAVGHEINVGNRWADGGLQTDVGGTRYTAGLQIVPDVTPTRDTPTYTVTISNASPAVFTHVSHGLPVNTPIRFFTTGALPTGLTAGTVYYVSATGLAANTFSVKTAVISGTDINTSSAGSGVHNYVPSFPASFGVVIGRSIHDHKLWTGLFLRGGTIMPGGYGAHIVGSQVAAGDQPAALIKAAGFSQYGIDFQGAVFSGAALNFYFADQNSATATAGAIVSPGNYQGFIIASMSGTRIKIPYFAN